MVAKLNSCLGRLSKPFIHLFLVDKSDDPYLGAERGEALEFAVLLLLLENLSPTERAAYVLGEAFGPLPPRHSRLIPTYSLIDQPCHKSAFKMSAIC